MKAPTQGKATAALEVPAAADFSFLEVFGSAIAAFRSAESAVVRSYPLDIQ
jgi:hypothetical protein